MSLTMNERIRKIYKEATGKVWAYDFDPQIAEKFAELLIRECLYEIDKGIPDTNCGASGPYKTARIAVTARIKEHFGIE